MNASWSVNTFVQWGFEGRSGGIPSHLHCFGLIGIKVPPDQSVDAAAELLPRTSKPVFLAGIPGVITRVLIPAVQIPNRPKMCTTEQDLWLGIKTNSVNGGGS